MKKNHLILTPLILAGILLNGYAQTIIDSTAFTNALATDGWSVTTGSAIAKSTLSSSNNTGSSGGDNLLLEDQFNFETDQIVRLGGSGEVNTTGFTDIKVRWNANLSSGPMPTVSLYYSTDNWGSETQITYTEVTNDGAWHSTSDINVDASNEAENVADLQFEFRYVESGTFEAYRIDDFVVLGTPISTFYNKTAATDLTLTSSWGANTDGSGSAPSDFVSDDQTFIVTNGTVHNITTTWTVSGTNSKITVEGGTELVIDAATNATIDVENQAQLTLNNATLPTFGSLASGSTVEYGTGPTVASGTYSNIIVSGTSVLMSGNVECDSLELTTDLDINGNVLTINGQLSGAGGTGVFKSGNTNELIIQGTGDFGTLNLSSPQKMKSLTMNRAGTEVSLGTNLILGGASSGEGMLTLTAGKLLTNNKQVRFDNSDITYNGGDLVGSSNCIMIILGGGSFSGIGLSQSDGDAGKTLNRLQNYRNGLQCKLLSDLIIDNELKAGVSSFVTTIDLNGKTIQFNEAADLVIGSAGSLFKGNYANLDMQGTNGSFSLTLDQSSDSSRSINNLIINRSAATITLGDATIFGGEIDIQAGTLDFAGQSVTLESNASATAQILNVQGTLSNATNVTVERYVAGTTGWRIFGAPGTGATIADYHNEIAMSGSGFVGSTDDSPTAFTSAYLYDESLITGTEVADSGYYIPTNTSLGLQHLSEITTSSPRGGIICYLTSQAGATTPIPLTADVTVDLSSNFSPITLSNLNYQSNGGSENAYHLITNPYPCGLDWSGIAAGASGVAASGAIWTVDGNQNFSPSTATVLASCQGGFIELTSGTNSITIDQSDKTSSDNFNAKLVNDVRELDLAINVNGHSDHAQIRFVDNTSEMFEEAVDARKQDNLLGKTNIAVMSSDNKVLHWNAMDAETNVTIPIVVYRTANTNIVESYTLNINNVDEIIAQNNCLVFEDIETGISFPLTGDTSYTFTMNDTVTQARLFISMAPSLTTSQTNVTCGNLNDGSISVFGAGPQVLYNWTDEFGNPISVFGGNLTNLTPGIYNVEVTGLAGSCPVARDIFEIQGPAPIIVEENITNVLCHNESTGEISLIVSGGEGSSYSYAWNDGSSNAELTGVSAGNYSVTVLDSEGCEIEKDFQITENEAITIVDIVNDASCFGLSDGAIDIAATSNTSFNYTFEWSNGATSEDLTNLTAGAYEVTVTDEHGCSIATTYNINEPIEIEADFVASTDTLLLNEGSVIVFNNQSVGSNDYSWDFDDGNTSTDMSPWHEFNTPGEYEVALTAGIGNCSNTQSQTIVVMSVNGSVLNNISSSLSFIQNGSILYAINPTYLNNEIALVKIHNSIGQEVTSYSDYFKNGQLSIQLPEGTGVYFISVESNNDKTVKKLVNTH